VEIEIKLARGVYAEETIDALFAFTECQQSISVNLLVIKDNFPVVMSVTEVIKHHAKQLVDILKRELEQEKKELLDKFHLRTLERIFIEERIYKAIENKKTAEAVQKAVLDGFIPFAKEIGSRGVTNDDVDYLLRIPIRRISLFDINKARDEMDQIKARIKEINEHLKNITAYAVSSIDGMIAKIKLNADVNKGVRRTHVGKFEKIDVKEISKTDVQIFYDKKTGYMGTAVEGAVAANVSSLDRILVLKNNGSYFVADIPEKSFVGENAWFIGAADKDMLSKTIFTLVYKEAGTGFPCIKRCIIEGWIMNKDYNLLPEGATVLLCSTQEKFSFMLTYVKKPRLKNLEQKFKAQDYAVKGLKAGGVHLAKKETKKAELVGKCVMQRRALPKS
jgi:topoisomerase-4 subunit A